MALTPERKKLLLFWLVAFLLPAALVLLVQIPLCKVKIISDFFEHLPPYQGVWVLTLCFFLPSYVLIYMPVTGWKKKTASIVILTAILGIYAPLLWIFGFYTSRLLFTACV